MERTQFTFDSSYYDAISSLKRKGERVWLFEAICVYSLYGILPETSNPRLLSLFFSIKPTMDKEIRQSIEGRRCVEYKEWRKAVYERDGYTCQLCGSRGVKLNAHHKMQYAHFPELRYAIDNGITLCVPCHKAIHRRR